MRFYREMITDYGSSHDPDDAESYEGYIAVKEEHDHNSLEAMLDAHHISPDDLHWVFDECDWENITRNMPPGFAKFENFELDNIEEVSQDPYENPDKYDEQADADRRYELMEDK